MKNYVLVGTGHRGISSYAVPICRDFADCASLCGVYDVNPKRAALVARLTGKPVPVFGSFDEMLQQTKPDTVIVTTKDCLHDEYIVRALHAGCDVITEKPLTTDADKCRRIFAAQRESGRQVRVTFNLRYYDLAARAKEIIDTGILGKVLSVHYEWFLDTVHGADYFRRWHRQRENSGSLLIHKATHHFDLANWFIGEDPVRVSAFGTRRFYGDDRRPHGERCRTCPYSQKCEFYLDISKDDHLRQLYLECEDQDGYYRDRCVFSDEIDIEDSVSLNVQYSGGCLMSYSLTAHSPYEGFRMVLNGIGGRLEVETIGGLAYHGQSTDHITFYDRSGNIKHFDREAGELSIRAEHGGADPRMREMIFRGNQPDPLHQLADLRAGAMSIGIGIAANISMKENRQVALAEFYDFL